VLACPSHTAELIVMSSYVTSVAAAGIVTATLYHVIDDLTGTKKLNVPVDGVSLWQKCSVERFFARSVPESYGALCRACLDSERCLGAAGTPDTQTSW
jgi:hypothetical protein